jgi:hypothetical protein
LYTASPNPAQQAPFNAFILKLDTSGNFGWARQFESAAGAGNGRGIAVKNGFVFLTGQYQGKTDFNPGRAAADTVYKTTGSSPNAYVAKLDTAGSFVWVSTFNGTSTGIGISIAADDAGNTYTTGTFIGTTDFDPGTGTQSASALGANRTDIFIVKLDPSGNFRWVNTHGANRNDGGTGITLDKLGSLYVTGYYTLAVDFDADPVTTALLSTTGVNDADGFLLKLDTLGKFKWVKQFAGTTVAWGMGVKVDASGNVYTAGSYIDSVHLDTSGIYLKAPSADWDLTFILKHNPEGRMIWAKSLGSGSGWAYPEGLDVNRSGHVFTIGVFDVVTNFDTDGGISP